jgi:hypothetical protein
MWCIRTRVGTCGACGLDSTLTLENWYRQKESARGSVGCRVRAEQLFTHATRPSLHSALCSLTLPELSAQASHRAQMGHGTQARSSFSAFSGFAFGRVRSCPVNTSTVSAKLITGDNTDKSRCT